MAGMIQFARLFAALDQTNSTNAKVDAMARYFATVPPADAAWAVFFLTGRRLKRLVPYASVSRWTLAATGLDEWLLAECYATVGDGAETAALVLDQLHHSGPSNAMSLAEWIEDRILPLRQMPPETQETAVLSWVRELDRWQRLVLFKLLTGELRLGVSQTLVVRALAQSSRLPATTVAARLMGDWTPTARWYGTLVAAGVSSDDLSRPFPFYLASPLEDSSKREVDLATQLGMPADWLVEWKWDGIRAQLVKRAGRVHLWSRGEELITDRFPEIVDAAALLPEGTVLDGEIIAFRDERPLPFAALQQRIGRQRQLARKARDVPVVFMAYDILEHAGTDSRDRPLAERRAMLERVIESMTGVRSTAADETRRAEPLLPFEDDSPRAVLRISPLVPVVSWDEIARVRAESRAQGVEGLMLKRRDSPYGVGRKRGDWWKWKIEPFTIDAVLIYAQPGSGKRASLLTDYTFGVWDQGTLVPVAKAYSGLTNDEIAEMDRWIRRHTVERFGPVRHVMPTHVFELGFEAIAQSSRHRSGIALRFPRMLRWRRDKPPAEADTLDTLRALLDDVTAGTRGVKNERPG